MNKYDHSLCTWEILMFNGMDISDPPFFCVQTPRLFRVQSAAVQVDIRTDIGIFVLVVRAHESESHMLRRRAVMPLLWFCHRSWPSLPLRPVLTFSHTRSTVDRGGSSFRLLFPRRSSDFFSPIDE